MQWMPEDVWEDRNFIVGLCSSVYLKFKGCVRGFERWYKTPKLERSNPALFFIKARVKYSTNGPTKLRRELIVKGGIRSSVREVFFVSYRELRSIHCKKEWLRRKLICVGCCIPKPLSLASLVNLGTRFLLRGVVLSHPEIFEFQDVIKNKNKTTIFS